MFIFIGICFLIVNFKLKNELINDFINMKICRFLTTGSIEEKIYQRQISKTFLSNAVMNIDPVSNARLSIEELKVI